MKKSFLLIPAIALTAMLGCNQSNERKMDQRLSEPEKSIPSPDLAVSTVAGDPNQKVKDRKFIRTAQMQFRTKDVVKTTTRIEDIAKKFEGFVTKSDLSSETNNVTSTAISEDSSLESTYYTVRSEISIRVPNTKLDSVLNEISKDVDYLVYRKISAEDVGLQIKANKMVSDRVSKMDLQKGYTKLELKDNSVMPFQSQASLSVEDVNASANGRYERLAESDAAKIDNLSLLDRINYSTVSVSIYQRPLVRRELIVNDKNIESFKPGFGTMLVEALGEGWRLIEIIFLGIVRLWSVIVLIIFAYFLYRRFAKNFK